MNSLRLGFAAAASALNFWALNDQAVVENLVLCSFA
jgi:hypothetical protein